MNFSLRSATITASVFLVIAGTLFGDCCCSQLPARFSVNKPVGMVWVPPGTFTMGSNDPEAKADEKPPHEVKLAGFWIDATPVTNREFKAFVDATGYVTTAEKAPTLEEIKEKGAIGTTPVKKYPPNGYGLYDMSGNVWQWCSDNYHRFYFAEEAKKGSSIDPKGPDTSYDPDEPYASKRVHRGGSFLCHQSYCKGYRITARMKTCPDTSLNHLGFRCAKGP
jgi:formylglycine-generating enzyme required for sulfatase activity